MRLKAALLFFSPDIGLVCFFWRTSPQGGGGDGAGLLAAPQGGVRLKIDGVGGGWLQVVKLVSEGCFTDSLLQFCTVRL